MKEVSHMIRCEISFIWPFLHAGVFPDIFPDRQEKTSKNKLWQVTTDHGKDFEKTKQSARKTASNCDKSR